MCKDVQPMFVCPTVKRSIKASVKSPKCDNRLNLFKPHSMIIVCRYCVFLGVREDLLHAFLVLCTFFCDCVCKPCSPPSPFSVIQWKIPRLPLCWLRKHRGCNQSSGCFGRNPSCLSLALLPHQRSTDYWGLRWEWGWEMGNGHGRGGADTPLTNTTVTSDEVLSKEWLCHQMNYKANTAPTSFFRRLSADDSLEVRLCSKQTPLWSQALITGSF